MKHLLSGIVGFAIVAFFLSCQSDMELKKNITRMRMASEMALQVTLPHSSIQMKMNVLNLSKGRIFQLIPLSEPKKEGRQLLKV